MNVPRTRAVNISAFVRAATIGSTIADPRPAFKRT